MKRFMSMPASLCTARHIIQIINAPNIEGDMTAALDKRQISPRISNFWKLKYLTIID